MSGHSKWSKVKHQKAVTDAVKAQAFTKASRGISLAVKEGGGITDPEKNFRLRLAIDKARQVNMPGDTIRKAIERGSDRSPQALAQITYEGYGPQGVAILVETATDNRQRTVSFIKNILEKSGGSLGSPGSVAYQFRQTGIILLPKVTGSYDDVFALALSCGADDLVEKDDVYELYCPASSVRGIADELGRKGSAVAQTDVIMVPVTPVDAAPQEEAQIHALVEALEALDDVMAVYTSVS